MAIDREILRKAQNIMLEMLVEFDTICEKHHLQYWLDAGTLLGAVRYQGFIPWDDDIDISMPLEDYNKFQEIAQDELFKNIFFQTTQTDKNFKFDYIKLRSNKAKIVEFHEKKREIDYHQGLFIDIFPMLTLPDTEFHKALYHDTFKLIRSVSSISLHTPEGKDNPVSRKKLVELLDKIHQGWKEKDTKVIYSGKMPDLAAWFDYREIFPLEKIIFEGLSFYAPKNPNHYLSEIYSFNYMAIPPKDKQTVHAFKIEFN